jgi:hypothetical protein
MPLQKVVEGRRSPVDIGAWKLPENLVKEIVDGLKKLGPPMSGNHLQIPGKRVS